MVVKTIPPTNNNNIKVSVGEGSRVKLRKRGLESRGRHEGELVQKREILFFSNHVFGANCYVIID